MIRNAGLDVDVCLHARPAPRGRLVAAKTSGVLVAGKASQARLEAGRIGVFLAPSRMGARLAASHAAHQRVHASGLVVRGGAS